MKTQKSREKCKKNVSLEYNGTYIKALCLKKLSPLVIREEDTGYQHFCLTCVGDPSRCNK